MSTMAPGAEGTKTLRRLMTATAMTCATLALAAAGAAPAGAERAKPTLLATSPNDNSGLLVRPGFMSFYHGDRGGFFDYLMGPGLTWGAYHHGKEPPVVWSRWGARAAGRATYWLGFPDSCSVCREIRRVVKLAAWRERDGHYTRFSITWRRSTVVYAYEPTRIPVNGLPGGALVHRWCWARIPQSCVVP
jgi:hypothetical protein